MKNKGEKCMVTLFTPHTCNRQGHTYEYVHTEFPDGVMVCAASGLMDSPKREGPRLNKVQFPRSSAGGSH